MKPMQIITTIALTVSFVLAGASFLQAETNAPLINKDELKAMLDQPEVTILDVRRGKDWKSSEFKIKGATFVEPGKYENWIKNYAKDKKFVLYCA